ncbi:hypothetical protein NHX12_009959 [Muraenolepis orangiensis]|uniref:Uncharacterized protein n=1 Tax=Muraenolepis orangiensis TaxID=630683 RepID=A0A9Q0DK79_9TELE|nr:hypothetical protein NHX12_009959 [Muraenolepis orangiensis]
MRQTTGAAQMGPLDSVGGRGTSRKFGETSRPPLVLLQQPPTSHFTCSLLPVLVASGKECWPPSVKQR